MTTISAALPKVVKSLNYKLKIEYYNMGNPDIICILYLSANTLDELSRKFAIYEKNIFVIDYHYTNHSYSAPELLN